MSRRRPEATGPSRRTSGRTRATGRVPRRRHRVLVALVVAGLAVATLVAGGEWLVRQSYFRVAHVQVIGATHETTAALLAATGLSDHPALIDVSGPSLEARLSAFPWIGSVSVEKHWPSSLVVRVRERVAVAVAFDARHVLRYVDAAGHDLGPAPLGANLPTLVFLHPSPGAWPYSGGARASAYVASRLPRAFSAQVAEVVEDHHGTVSLKMTTPVSFVLGPATDLHAKFVAVASVIAHTTLRPGDVIDVTVPGALAVTGPPPS